jgi:hypothetical protein
MINAEATMTTIDNKNVNRMFSDDVINQGRMGRADDHVLDNLSNSILSLDKRRDERG